MIPVVAVVKPPAKGGKGWKEEGMGKKDERRKRWKKEEMEGGRYGKDKGMERKG